ncbi:MAG TPA: HAD family hydrolase [Thermoanaerobaculia bacterium]|nr:HAD family hydrolase [Thermoanaerobaculia bacterium]
MVLRIADFRAFTFDCYGTLIDWELGIGTWLSQWAESHGVSPSGDELLQAFARAENRVEQENPTSIYPDILEATLRSLGGELGIEALPTECAAFGASVGGWPPFPDTRSALRLLKERYRLVVVSNVDRASFARTNEKLGVAFDAIIMAEEVGAYKPDHRMFLRAFEVLKEMEIGRGQILHVAQSLYHDHVPAKELGLSTVWVNRRRGQQGWGATTPPPSPIVPDLEVGSLAELVALDDAQRG